MAHRRAWISSSRCPHSSRRVYGSRDSGANLECQRPFLLIGPCSLAGLARVADHPLPSLLQVDGEDHPTLGVLRVRRSHRVSRCTSWRPYVATDRFSVHQDWESLLLGSFSLLTRLGGHS